ncbi:hypothetical protein BU16DRAFT_529477 [Lophium mytilinum]|uniref:Uncharacterized protein n=1 Tax=Lophium mytilinum TaxID=390894 RepID=A0A6A6QJ36_9PEZI|nr:hypothetical protein BU16DRAFT_529477 [Lophium mytilinum]
MGATRVVRQCFAAAEETPLPCAQDGQRGLCPVPDCLHREAPPQRACGFGPDLQGLHATSASVSAGAACRVTLCPVRGRDATARPWLVLSAKANSPRTSRVLPLWGTPPESHNSRDPRLDPATTRQRALLLRAAHLRMGRPLLWPAGYIAVQQSGFHDGGTQQPGGAEYTPQTFLRIH